MQLVTPPSPFVAPEAVVGMAVYTAKAMLHGKGSHRDQRCSDQHADEITLHELPFYPALKRRAIVKHPPDASSFPERSACECLFRFNLIFL